MRQRGRGPLALGHIDRLSGSARAKERMIAFLTSLETDGSALEARQQLGLSESHFHQLRHDWLQGALAILEPRVPGRRRHVVSAAEERVAALEQEVQQLQRALALSQARCEVLAATGAEAPHAKKGLRCS